MDLGDDGETGAARSRPSESLDEVELPERPVAIERSRLHAPDQLAQLVLAARARQGTAAYVVGDVEVLVIHPHGVGQMTRDPAHLLPVSGLQADALGDQLTKRLVVERLLRGQLEQRDAADMHRGGRRLQVEERDVQWREPVCSSTHAVPPLFTPECYGLVQTTGRGDAAATSRA